MEKERKEKESERNLRHTHTSTHSHIQAFRCWSVCTQCLSPRSYSLQQTVRWLEHVQQILVFRILVYCIPVYQITFVPSMYKQSHQSMLSCHRTGGVKQKLSFQHKIRCRFSTKCSCKCCYFIIQINNCRGD